MMIVTCRPRCAPSVVLRDLHGYEKVDDVRRYARGISERDNGAVVWLLDDDGEVAWFRYNLGRETQLVKEEEWWIVA